ncbi:hypothetical protein EV401DRAFT_2126056 [Pisolithus croceorrhizus]|nr:hypothetical protein EV401DRAFT_2126056 [Pisolithus croceorrhizus]
MIVRIYPLFATTHAVLMYILAKLRAGESSTLGESASEVSIADHDHGDLSASLLRSPHPRNSSTETPVSSPVNSFSTPVYPYLCARHGHEFFMLSLSRSSPHANPLPYSLKAWTEPLAGTALALPDHFKACALEGELFVEYLQNAYEDEIPKRNHVVFQVRLPIS